MTVKLFAGIWAGPVIRADLCDITDVIGALRIEGNIGDRAFEGVSIDSRTVESGNLFFAIEGKNEDGHRFVPEALARGASAAVVHGGYSYGGDHSGARLIAVDDTLSAMHRLASWWLSRFDLIRVAITGTNGKTTTKEMTASVLAGKYRTYKSPGNFNNLYGVPLALFGMSGAYDVAVFEFGMSTPGEIAVLTRLVRPQYGVITNIDAAHLETMLTVDAIAQAKFELLDNMPEDGTAILNLDNPYLRERFGSERLTKLGFGVKGEYDISPTRYEMNGSGRARFHLPSTGEVSLSVPGIHNMYNALAAAAVGHLLTVPGDRVRAALEAFECIEMRTETVTVSNVTIINDTYNANPVSVRFALDTLGSIETDGRKIAVLGDMLELGEQATELHREVGAYAAGAGLDCLVVSGDLARGIAEGAIDHGYPADRLAVLGGFSDVIDYLLDYLHPGDVVLIKASRSMAFDRITLGLRSQIGRDN